MSLTYKARCWAFVENEDEIWYSECNFNALICVEKAKGIIREIIKIPYNLIHGSNLYLSMAIVNKELILIPFVSDKLVFYDLEKRVFSSIKIVNYIGEILPSYFKMIYQYRNNIILFPNIANKILIYDSIKKEIQTIEIKDDILKKTCCETNIKFRAQFEVVGEYLFVPFAESGAILVLDLQKKQVVIKLIDGLEGCSTINYYNGNFYLAAWNKKKIYVLDTELQIVHEYIHYPVSFKSEKHIFSYSLLMEEKILYFPQLCDEILSFDLNKKVLKKEMTVETSNNDFSKTYLVKPYEKKIIALTADDFWLSIYFYSEKNLVKRPYSSWNKEYNERRIINYLFENCYFDYIHESEDVDIGVFQEVLLYNKKNYLSDDKCRRNEIVGKKIYEYVVKG